MNIIVQKYGGTSLGSIERINNVALRIKKWSVANYKLVIVVSAMSGKTNELNDLAHQIDELPEKKSLDFILSSGEQISAGLLSISLNKLGLKTELFNGSQIPIKTDSNFTKARIENIQQKLINEAIKKNKIVIVTGFQGVNNQNQITTLGRGGSDTSAVAVAAAINAKECQIFTDVDGVYTTDPRIYSRAKRLSEITFEEMLEMAGSGSKVLQIRSVEMAGKYKLPLRVLSSLTKPDIDIKIEKNSGTLITFEENITMEKEVVTGIAFNRNETKFTLLGVPDKPGIAHKILLPISKANIEIDVIVQNISKEGLTDFSFTVNKSDSAMVNKIIDNLVNELNAKSYICDDEICKIGLVGVGMRSNVGIADKMFSSLANENINIQMISTSEIKITVVIDDKYTELAIKVLHDAFELDKH
jgi:aspartate kinase